jgi:hypothetical protein
MWTRPTKLSCADIAKGTLARLEIHQCSMCKIFVTAKIGLKANVLQEQYGVRF